MSKRFFLIAGGTVGGLGAVLAITPPQFGTTSGLKLGGTSLTTGTSTTTGSSTLTSIPTQQATPAPVASKAVPAPTATKKTATKKSTKTSSKSATTRTTSSGTSSTSSQTTTSQTSTPSQQSTPAAVSTPAAPAAPAAISGTFTGAAANTRFGPVQVQVTIVNNKITNATALQYPTESFRDQQINQQAIPYLIQETLAAQSANIQGVGGASYTSTGWILSLQSALAKAGL